MTTAVTNHTATETLFIPCAGRGSRLAIGGTRIPKPLVTVNMKPAVAHVIDLYPPEWSIVIALGAYGDIVRDGIEAYFWGSERADRITFTYSDSWQSDGKGLSHTLLDAREAIGGQSFVFHAVDSLFNSDLPWGNWITDRDQLVLGRPAQAGIYRALEVSRDGTRRWVRNEVDTRARCALVYTGVAHVVEVRKFWSALKAKADQFPEAGETLGLDPNTVDVFELVEGEWLDVGTPTGLTRASRHGSHGAVVLPKVDETLWFTRNSVIKFHLDSSFIKGRVRRSVALNGSVPEIHFSNEHAFVYDYVPGQTVSSALLSQEFDHGHFLSRATDFWYPSVRPEEWPIEKSNYLDFYRTKTHRRIADLRKIEPGILAVESISGLHVGSWEQQEKHIPWDLISAPLWGRTHGDFHPENMIINEKGELILLDWRQDMAGHQGAIGDVYYDLGKLAHGLRVDHGYVAEGRYIARIQKDKGTFFIESVPEKARLYESLQEFVESRGWSWPRVQLIEAIIYLNIAPLHEPSSYRTLLGLLGRWMLESGGYGKNSVRGPASAG